MPLDIFKFHTDPTKLKGHGNDIVSLYHWLDKFLDKNAMPELKNQSNYINNKSKIEHIIASGDSEDAYNYAKHILNGPFKLGEKAIATDAYSSFMYAHDVLRGRFEMGEEVMKKDKSYWDDYQEGVLSPTAQRNFAWLNK